MQAFKLTLSFPSGAVLVGGYSAIPEGYHAVHARAADGRPLIPATAVRGALRQMLEALLRGTGEPACSGGDGNSAESGDQPPGPCTLRDGERCRACRLFGSQREGLSPGERFFSALVLGAAYAESADFAPRPGVGIGRKVRSAADQRLFFRQIPNQPDLRFVAHGRLLDASLKPLLEAATRSVTHLGSGRSRGLARVDAKLLWLPDAPAHTSPASTQGDLFVQVKLTAPASIGVPVADDFLRDTRREIPGAAVRGAVGFALAEVLPDPDHDAAFQALVADAGAHFGFLTPHAGAPDSILGLLPLTAAACKHEGRRHGLVDTLLDRLATVLIQEPAQVASIQKGALSKCGCAIKGKVCSGPLRTIGGSRSSETAPPTRTVFRLAMDRTSDSAREKLLFGQVLLEPGTVFAGLIRNIPAESRQRLQLALGRPLSFGRGRSMGWGQADVQVSPVPRRPGIKERGARFDAALRQHLQVTGLPLTSVGRLVPVTLLSPLLPESTDDDGERLLLAATNAKRCVLRIRRFVREGGWDQRSGKIQPELAVTAGGVFVLELAEGQSRESILPRLEALEQSALGRRRSQGYGQVLCFDPFILQRTQREVRKEPEMDMASQVHPHRRALVMAAEKVMKDAFESRDGEDVKKLKKAQLNHLIGVCGEAACVEEIANYLRYQASRRDAGWRREMVKKLLEEFEKALQCAANAESLRTDGARVAAFQLYAVYLTRTFTYYDKVQLDRRRVQQGANVEDADE